MHIKNYFREGFFRELKNLEASGCYTSVARVLNEYQFFEGHIQRCATELLSYQEDIQYVKNLNPPSQLTKVLHEKIFWRKEYLLSLRSSVAASIKSYSLQERQAGELLMPWITFNFGKKLYQPSFTHHNSSVRNLLHDLTLRPDLRRAVDIVGVQTILDKIEEITTEIIDTMNKRIRKQSAQGKRAATIRSDVYRSLRKFLHVLAVEIMMEDNQDGFYAQLGRRINKTLENFRTPYVARTTRYRNLAQKHLEQERVEDNKVEVSTAKRANSTPNTPKEKSGPVVEAQPLVVEPIAEASTNGKQVHQEPMLSIHLHDTDSNQSNVSEPSHRSNRKRKAQSPSSRRVQHPSLKKLLATAQRSEK